MYFIFGYCREVPVKIERDPSKLALIGLAILIVVLFVFLTFENLGQETRVTDLVFHAPGEPAQVTQADDSANLDLEALWRSELKNRLREKRRLQSQ